jgi:broad specificity phosphatase PhoE
MTPTIYLVRHGESLWNGEKRITGQLDPPLTAAGQAQAERLVPAMQGLPLTAIVTSALTRSIATARPLAHARGIEPQVLADLNEQHFGVLQGRYRDARDPEALSLWTERQTAGSDHALPGGESFHALLNRVSQVVQDLLHTARRGPVLVVGHRHTNRALLCALLGWSYEQARGAAIRHHFVYGIAFGATRRVTSISIRDRDPGRVRVGLWL